MAKFYVTCGSFTFLTSANDARSAAVWAIHRFLAERVDLDSIDWTDPETVDRTDLMDAMLELGETVRISEIGFERTDAGELDAADVLTEWNYLVVAVSRLEEAFGEWC